MKRVATRHEYQRLSLAEAGMERQERRTLHPCICDRCGGLVQGLRFKCLVCDDFDLCATCRAQGCPSMRPQSVPHEDNHAMLLLHSALPHHTVASLVAAFHRGDVEALESVDVEDPRLGLTVRPVAVSHRGTVCPCPGETPSHQVEVSGSCQIRLMTGDDLDALVSVENVCFVQPYSRDTFETIARHGSCITYVAEFVESLHRHFAGYLILQLEGAAMPGGYVMSLAVLPRWRSKGIAKALMLQALEDARGNRVGEVELHVHTQNRGAIRLYRRCGFEILREERGFYDGLDLQSGDAYAMRAVLGAEEQ
eukprot:symbB.v1.2.018424.t1/scaffold1470.1/size116919/7